MSGRLSWLFFEKKEVWESKAKATTNTRDMADDEMSASQLRQRYGRGGSAPDNSLSASQLRGRYGVENKDFSKGDGGGAMMIVMVVAAIAVIVGALVFFMQKS
ncbi:hypothetical protein GUITHDRAFT_116608 [Guillardia theta CCMP2712]|uniref:Uncharacterized protein n=1 Tax=Guillardia theta (strain CCMP2712) TaxID=905079 RepID=L1IMS8_GUITC|nr:hypothetical protein GUITHDRAFT_116608 [Guillardia theta CCMP2712]EKX37194.1 hypothetical protein GUITHDRAFT_116608 [Guillardia theta CCMP2712]|eukprot:XP_005824174.1 hypothetical protein GUITHDRAFT_116608 [Guillardia theta CCMP2712]